MCKIVENDAYADGVEVKSVMNMIDDIVSAYNGKTDQIRIPDPLNGKALIKTIRVDGSIDMQNLHCARDPNSTHAKFKSRRAMAKELRGSQRNISKDFRRFISQHRG